MKPIKKLNTPLNTEVAMLMVESRIEVAPFCKKPIAESAIFFQSS